ncbi:MAG TPA: glyoxylate/hydroxypyruvate reductase A [Afifellaceae bacterium]|nr:glyoxylate/hydroxypyruvate reductase A [Afifellaceae bacterium]
MSAVLVAVDGWSPEPWARRLREQLPDRAVLATDESGIYHGDASDLGTVSHLVTWKPRPDLLAKLSGLKAIYSMGAGVDHILNLETLPDVPIVRIVDPDLTARMSEYVVWQVLHHHRQGPAYRRQQDRHVWEELRQPAARELTVGMLGVGVLGQDAAKLLRQIGFATIGWSRSEKQIDGMACFHGRDGLDDMLAQTDILVALLPLTPETEGVLDARLIDRLRRDGPLGGPVLINAGRGGSQVDADIAAALADGRLAGASLDVFPTEPLPADSPLWDAPNLVITPHAAAVSSPRALCVQIAEQIRALDAGRPLANVVDRERGY